IMSALGNKILRSAETILASNSAVRLLGAIGKPVSPKELRAALQNGLVKMERNGLVSESPVSAALDSDQHHSMLQPVLNTRDAAHPLALVQSQWTHPGLANRRDNLIDAEVEHSELAHSILRHHMRNLGIACAQWQGSGAPSPRLAFSLTAAHLQDRGLADWARTIGARFALPPDRIIFLIDERSLVSPSGPRMVNALADAGFGVGIHHYGEGDTAIGTMQSLPIDVVVTAPSLAARMDASFEARMLLESTLRISDMLKVESVAAGVDTDSVRHDLQTMGYTQLTGHAVSPPLSTDAYRNWLTSRSGSTDNAGAPVQAGKAA
ncbi:MAG: EAL domain-containing protein, partial [Oceanococcaceae bacterium]